MAWVTWVGVLWMSGFCSSGSGHHVPNTILDCYWHPLLSLAWRNYGASACTGWTVIVWTVRFMCLQLNKGSSVYRLSEADVASAHAAVPMLQCFDIKLQCLLRHDLTGVVKHYMASSWLVVNCSQKYSVCFCTLCLKKVYHTTTNDNFNRSCLIPVIFGTYITEWICHWKMA